MQKPRTLILYVHRGFFFFFFIDIYTGELKENMQQMHDFYIAANGET